MKKWIKSKWTDPVWSKVFSNLIWTAVLSLATGTLLLIQKLYNNISWTETLNRVRLFFNSSSTIPNKWIVLIILIFLFAVINKISILSILKIFRGPYGTKDYVHIFDNQKCEENGTVHNILTAMSLNTLLIKPSNESQEWIFRIYISHTHKESDESHLDPNLCLTLHKKIQENSLYLVDSKKNKEFKIFDDYFFQGIKIIFEHSRGGIVIKYLREKNFLYQSENYFGHDYFFYTASGNNHDFLITVVHTKTS